MELLFESRSNLSGFMGTLHFVQHKPEVHMEPVMLPDTFVDEGGINGYGTVLNENGKLRMWYQAIPRDWPGNCEVGAVAYAESDDGYHWKKPALGIVAHGASVNNLCNLGLHSPSLFIDPDAPSTHRYLAVGCGRDCFLGQNVRYGYYTAHSSDGLYWELDSTQPQWEGGDVVTSIYHPGRRSGLIALKKEPWINRLVRRSIRTAEYKDGVYSNNHVSALYPDDYDDIAAAQRGHFTSDYYGMAMMPAGQNTVGFVWNFRHDLPYSQVTPLGNHGPSDITLVFQENEGDRWLHMPGRPDFISHRDLSWTAAGWIHSTSAPVEVGDQHRLYFCGRNYEHYGFREPGGKRLEQWSQWLQENGMWAMTFAHWPKYRLFGFEAPRDASFNIELRDVHEPFEVRLNYRTRKGGRVYASIHGDQRYHVQNCKSLAGNQLNAPLTWENGSVIYPSKSGKVLLTLHLEMAAVYAYEVVKAV